MTDKLNSNVTISRQFLRSVNLEADLGRTDALQGYICQDTAKSLVKNMAHHLNQSRQKAFTWTGPYGGGKSSLALVLGSLVSPIKELKTEAKKLLKIEAGDDIELAFGSSRLGMLMWFCYLLELWIYGLEARHPFPLIASKHWLRISVTLGRIRRLSYRI